MTDRDRATQDVLLDQFVKRLRSQVKEFTESGCFVTDQEQPSQWPSGNIVCTVCFGAGKFPEPFFAGGGHATVCETTILKVSPFIRCKLDRPPTYEQGLVGDDKGLLSRFKPRVLRALLCEEKDGRIVAWEPCDKDGTRLLRNQLSPSFCSEPRPSAEGDYLGFTLGFDVTFDWKL